MVERPGAGACRPPVSRTEDEPRRIVEPAAGTRIIVPASAGWPAIAVRSDATGPHRWQGAISWHHFREPGTVQTPDNLCQAGEGLKDLGGDVTITATAGRESARTTLTIVGSNPAAHQVDAYLATQPDSAGFAAILRHETNDLHFCEAGLALFAQKVTAARRYLGQSGRIFTAAQLNREAVARWNGGAYHRWNDTAWERNDDMLCDPATGNIGWDMTDAANAGQTLEQSRRRDRGSFRRLPGDDAHWRYSGICYADALLD